MASTESRRRERTVCESCELPYYADADGCPYCGAASGGRTPDSSADAASSKDDEFVYGDDEPGAEPTADGDSAGRDEGLVARLRGALGL